MIINHRGQDVMLRIITYVCSILILLTCLAEKLHAQYYNQKPEYLNANSNWIFSGNTAAKFDENGIFFDSYIFESRLNNVGQSLIPSSNSANALTSSGASDTGTREFLFGVRSSGPSYCVNKQGKSTPNGILSYAWGPRSVWYNTLIIPKIGDQSKYYIFYTCYDKIEFQDGTSIVTGYSKGLFYSVVDMELDNGLGDVIVQQKDIPIDSTNYFSGALLAVPGDNCDIWLIAHSIREPVFKVYHITEDGFNPNPIISVAGTRGMPSILEAYTWAGMIGSPDRKKLAIYSKSANQLQNNFVNIFNFDPSTGIVSNGFQVGNYERISDFAFSPDNSKLYLAHVDTTKVLRNGPWNRAIAQYDISVFDSARIAISELFIEDSYSNKFKNVPYSAADKNIFYGLRLFRDKIYVNTNAGASHLSIINQPNLRGRACGFQYAGTPLVNPTQGYRFPSDVVYPLPPDTIKEKLIDTIICTTNNELNYQITATQGYDEYEWSDGYTASERIINQPGTYWVLCKNSCHSRIDTFIIHQKDITFSLGNDTILCTLDSFQITVDVSNASYIWHDGSNSSDFTATRSGEYSVTVIQNGCATSDSIYIEFKNINPDLGEDIRMCKGSEVLLNPRLPPKDVNYKWSTGEYSSLISVQDSGSYWVEVSNPPCVSSDTVDIYLETCECSFNLPNAFSPNSDGLNDELLPIIESSCGVRVYKLNIFNRFGERVFHSNNPNFGWDGLIDGIPADIGVYFYEIYFVGGTKDHTYYAKGDVTLVR